MSSDFGDMQWILKGLIPVECFMCDEQYNVLTGPPKTGGHFPMFQHFMLPNNFPYITQCEIVLKTSFFGHFALKKKSANW